jgi:hypothetical protein
MSGPGESGCIAPCIGSSSLELLLPAHIMSPVSRLTLASRPTFYRATETHRHSPNWNGFLEEFLPDHTFRFATVSWLHF